MADAPIVTYATLTLSTLVLVWHMSRRKHVNPPSPTTWPLIGNLLSMSSGPEYLTFKKLGEELNSDVVSLEVLGNKMVILNSAKAASELLEQRSALYSDRICPVVIKDPELFDWSGSTGMLGYNDVWRYHRRMISKVLGSREISQFSRIQERQTRSMLQALTNTTSQNQPFEGVKQRFLLSMASTMFELIYGYCLQNEQDPFFQGFQEILQHGMDAVMFTNFYVNIFPILAHIPDWAPGAGWKRTIRGWRDQKARASLAPLEWTKAQIEAGVSQPSLLGMLLEEDLTPGISIEERDRRLKEIGLALYAGGTESSATILMSFVAAMVFNPEVQAKAQLEIDTVLGPCSLPSIADRERLPYVNSLISEVMRWRPPLPTGKKVIIYACIGLVNSVIQLSPMSASRMTTPREIRLKYDFNLATGSFGNIWAMSRDESIYSSPETFDPERFLDSQLPQVPAFGWGRRRCPGASFGENSVFIAIASLLATFTFSSPDGCPRESASAKLENTSNSLFL
ncbi:cytochrome P450, partial [Rhizoctonia solani]